MTTLHSKSDNLLHKDELNACGIWVTKDGAAIQSESISDEHLFDIIKVVILVSRTMFGESRYATILSASSFLNGEFALLTIDDGYEDFDEYGYCDDDEFYSDEYIDAVHKNVKRHPFYKTLESEISKRGLDIKIDHRYVEKVLD